MLLREATGSPGFYTAHPMQSNRLLANIWAPDVAPESIGDAEDPDGTVTRVLSNRSNTDVQFIGRLRPPARP